MTNPTSVTSRYVSNLLTAGCNDEFILESVVQAQSTPVGFHYIANVRRNRDPENQLGYGVTPMFAVRLALEAFGVTFR